MMALHWIDRGGNLHEVPGDDVSVHRDLDEHRYEAVFDTGDEPLHGVAVVPDDEEPVFQLLSVQVDLDTPSGLVSLRRLAGGAEDLGVLATEHMRVFPVHGFTYFVADGRRPRLLLRLDPRSAGEDEFFRLRLRLLRLDATYVASFRQHFLGALKDAENRNQALAAALEAARADSDRAERLERELKVIRTSRAWRLAEGFRHLVYHRALARFPAVRERLLGLSRRNVQRSFSGEERDKLGVLATGKLRDTSRDDTYQALIDDWEAARPADDVLGERIAALAVKPLISVIMPVHDTPAQWLQEAIASVLGQRYDNFELCLCDDASSQPETLACLAAIDHPRVRRVRSESGLHIAGATNKALAMARGDYVAFVDHDDRLDIDALYHVVLAINESAPDLVYTDEDYLDGEGRRFRPNFKPDFSPDLLLSHNYITHLLVVRRALLEETGPLDSAFDGAQDHDLVLRLSERAASIVHVPRVLYHWRQSSGSSSLDTQAKPYVQERARGALAATMQRRGIAAEILDANQPHFFYTRRRLPDSPSVSIVIPFRDQPALLEGCLNSVLRKSTWSEYEIVGVNNQSASPITYELMEAYRANPRVRFVEHDQPFNFSAIVNHGVAEARGEYVVLLNNDIEIITWQWIEELLCQAVNESTGVVGGKLFYPDNTVQHAGIVVGMDGYAGHAHKHLHCHDQGYANRAQLVQNVSAVTGAFLMVRKALYESVGGFNERDFAVACNDVDFCLRVIEAGYWNVFTPYAQAYHLESASRGYELTEEKRKRFEREKALFRERHADMIDLGDPFYNPNLSLAGEPFGIRLPRGQGSEA